MTERLDLGRVRGNNGANGNPAVVEVLEDTATSYILGITYFTPDGTEHQIQTPNLLGAEGSATYTVTDDASLQKWLDADDSNDYTYVVVKPGNYTLSGTLKLADAGTQAVSGFGAELSGITIRGTGTEVSAGLKAAGFVDMLTVITDGKTELRELSTEIEEISKADTLMTDATAANYNLMRHADGGVQSALTGCAGNKVASGIRAINEPGSTMPSVIYVTGDGDDYVLKGNTKLPAHEFNIPSAIRRVLASVDGDDLLRLHILTTDGNLYYAHEKQYVDPDTSETYYEMEYIHIESGMPSDDIIDIMHSPDTVWTDAMPYPAMLSATRVYIQPNLNTVLGFTPTRAWTLSQTTGTSAVIAVRKSGGGLANVLFTNPSTVTVNDVDVALPAAATVYAGAGQLLVNNAGVLTEIANLNGGTTCTEINVEASTDIFYDGFDESVFADAEFVCINGKWFSSPVILNGGVLGVSFPALSSGTAYMKVTDWEGGEVLIEQGKAVTANGTTLAYVFCPDDASAAVWLTPDASQALYKENTLGLTGQGFTEKDTTEGVEILKMADGTQVVPRKVMYPDVFNPKNGQYRWLRFDQNNHKALIIQKGVTVNGNVSGYDVVHEFAEDTSFDLGTLSNGVDYYAVLTYDGKNFGMTAKTAAQLAEGDVVAGRFHTVCVDYGDSLTMTMRASSAASITAGTTEMMIKPYRKETDPDFYAFYKKVITAVTGGTNYKVVTCAHPLAGYKAGEIIPESIWCKDFFPVNLVDDAVVFDQDTGKAIDIYLQSGTGTLTRSAYNAGAATHTVNRTPLLHSMDMADVGKNLLTDWEFTCAAKGSNEMTNIAGSSDKTYVGGHVDTAGRRMVSAIGCEEMCGYLWQWLDELGSVGDNTSGWTTAADSDAKFGQNYGLPYVLPAGGVWDSGVRCGSVARSAGDLRSHVYGSGGGRGSSRVCRGGRYSA